MHDMQEDIQKTDNKNSKVAVIVSAKVILSEFRNCYELISFLDCRLGWRCKAGTVEILDSCWQHSVSTVTADIIIYGLEI